LVVEHPEALERTFLGAYELAYKQEKNHDLQDLSFGTHKWTEFWTNNRRRNTVLYYRVGKLFF